jgi:hypothetical protein
MSRTLTSRMGPLAWATLLVLVGVVGVGTAAFLRTPDKKLPPESVPRTIPDRWVLPPGRVVILVPDGTPIPARWPFTRPVRERQLREYGFVLARTASELDQVVQDGAVVIWIHRDAVHWVDPDWVRARHLEGRPVGVIGGTMEELRNWFDVGPGAGGWLRPGGPLPTFALFDGRQCWVGPREPSPGGYWVWDGGISEKFALGWVVSASHRAATRCT